MRALSLLPALLLLACGHRDGIVGTLPLGAAGESNAGSGPGFFDEFVGNSGVWQELPKVDGASTTVGVGDDAARDGRTAELRFPGNPAFGATDQVGPRFGPELDTIERFHFGTYRTRIGFGECDAAEEAVMSFVGYFNDGQDRDGDGIVDEQLISLQMLCGTPSRLYLTVFTDYEETPALRFRKLTRAIDFSSGQLSDTPRSDQNGLAPSGSDASLARPELFTAGAFYELGFEWHTDSIRFFAVLDGSERELWTLTGAERIPQQPLHLVFHLWHPDQHWYPTESPADYPARDVVLRVDWVSFEPE